ncbi:conserved protein of unknown function [Methanocaldococcus lauensis]|nr:conserved protein of unknown function [Methanocaldococcus lauensis]
MRFTLKLILILGIFVIFSTVYADAPKVVRAYLGVYEYNGTYQDPLGNTFEGESSYHGQHYYYTVLIYELDNGQKIRQVISLKDNDGATNPAPTTALYWKDPEGNIHQIFTQSGGQTYNVTPIPYKAEIPIGSQIRVVMNDNYRDNNYADGHWDINITENGIRFEHAHQSGGFWHNASFILTDPATNKSWIIPMPYKNSGGREEYSGIIPLNGSNAIIYDISGNSPYTGKSYTVSSPKGFIHRVKAPIPVTVSILTVVLITLLLVYTQRNKK